jgi:hypothetical protein
VVPLSHDNVQVCLTRLPRVLDPLLENLLRFLHELSVQVDGIAGHFAHGVVLAEDKFRSLFIVLIGFGGVFLALGAHFVGSTAVAALVGSSRLRGVVLVLALFFAGEVA